MQKYQSSNPHHKLFLLVCTPNCGLPAAGPMWISVFTTASERECHLVLLHAHGPIWAIGLCFSPRLGGVTPASKEKVLYQPHSSRRGGTFSYVMRAVCPPQRSTAEHAAEHAAVGHGVVRGAGRHHSCGDARLLSQHRHRS